MNEVLDKFGDGPHWCHLCGSGVLVVNHGDEGPLRVYCDKCAGCDSDKPEDLCDACWHVVDGVSV